jgi:prepilin-type N-terminal cleavage/methylation domain-containing protein
VVRSRPGYTLLELVVVLALLVTLTALAYPSLETMYGGYRITAATDQVRAGWAEARARALEEGRPYRFAIVPNQGNYRIAPDGGEYWAGGGGEVPPPEDPTVIPLVSENALPKGVRFATPDTLRGGLPSSGDTILPPGTIDPGSWTTLVTFLPDGTTSQNVEIIFHGRGARPVALRLRSLTGAVTLQRYDTEGGQR